MNIVNNLFYSALLSIFTFVSSAVFSQNFTGKIVYQVQMLDTNVQKIIDDREMTVYTNDTLTRIVILNDALGEQVTIKHMSLKKSYLLMNMGGHKLAIRTNSEEDSTTVEPYQITYKRFGKKKMNGFVMKKAIVYRTDLVEKRTVWYFKDLRPDLMDMYKGIKGLPADFYIGTVDGIVHYKLKSIEKMDVNKDLFGIPSDYEKITLEEFMKYVRGGE